VKKFTKSSVVEYACPFFEIVKEEIEMPTGDLVTHYIHHRSLPFVVVIGFAGDKVLVSRQWRPILQEWNWEFPMGGADKDEALEESAKRELLEETGYTCKSCQQIGTFLVGSGHTDQKGIVFIAYDVVKNTSQELEVAELIEVKLSTNSRF
jgi:ADP-ribose pyrophosphatase